MPKPDDLKQDRISAVDVVGSAMTAVGMIAEKLAAERAEQDRALARANKILEQLEAWAMNGGEPPAVVGQYRALCRAHRALDVEPPLENDSQRESLSLTCDALDALLGWSDHDHASRRASEEVSDAVQAALDAVSGEALP